MNKTIVIGIGGTGLDVIRDLRRKIVETRGSLEAAPHLGFFYIDTDDKEIKPTEDNRKRWEILGKSVALSPGEYYIIPAPDFGTLSQNLAAYPNIRDWLPMEQLKVLDQTDKQAAGARQIRALGRLGFTLATNEVERDIKAKLGQVTAPPAGGDTQVFFVCSLSGGTGSGIFLDLAYRMKNWVIERHQSHAFLVFPDLSLKRDERYVPNAYAALKELNYFSLAGSKVRGGTERIGFRLPGVSAPIYDKPFDFSYIVGTRNRENVTISLSGVAEMIAHRLFLSFDSSFAEDARGLLNNGGAERAMPYTDQITGNLHSRNFFTFGLSSIEYPTDEIKEMIAWKIAGTLFDGWVSARNSPGNVNDMVRSMIAQMKLSDEYLLADKNVFADGGANLNFDDYKVQVRNEVEQIVSAAPDTNQTVHFSDKVKDFLTTYRNRGVVAFYQDRMNDLEGAINEIVKQVRPRVNDFIQIPALGYDHAVHWLDEVIRYCTDRKSTLTAELQGEIVRLQNSPETLERGYADLTVAEGKWFFKESALGEGRTVVRDTLTLYLTSYASTQAMPYALRVLDGVLQHLRMLSNELKDWRLTLDKVSEEISKEQERHATFFEKRLAGDTDFNGSILFEPTTIQRNYNLLDKQTALRFVSDRLTGKQDVVKLLSTPESRAAAREDAFKLALRWMDEESRVLISSKTVADQLMEELGEGKEAKRREVLQTNRTRSSPFLAFDRMEIAKYGGSSNLSTSHAALLSDENGTIPNVVKIKDDLRTVGYPKENIKVIMARHQILFLQEETAFTLRTIADLKEVKTKYQDYLANAGRANAPSVPLHLQKSYSPDLMDLMLPDVEVYHKAQEDFLVGWINERIRFESNQKDQIEEIRYRYEVNGSSQWATLGTTWEPALDYWMREGRDAEAVRQILHEENERLWKQLSSQPKKMDYASKLSRHLESIKQRCEHGEESDVYKLWDTIRQRIMARHALPVPAAVAMTAGVGGHQPAPVSIPAVSIPAVSDPAVTTRFRKLVDLAVKTGKGALPQSFAQSLEVQRKALGLSEAEGQQAIQESLTSFNQPDPLELYRRNVAEFLAAGEIGDDQRHFLTEMILTQGLDPDAADKIESDERLRRRGA